MLTVVHGCGEDRERTDTALEFHVMAPLRTSEVSLGFYQLASLAESSTRSKKKIAVNSASLLNSICFNMFQYVSICFMFFFHISVWSCCERSSQLLVQLLPLATPHCRISMEAIQRRASQECQSTEGCYEWPQNACGA